MQFVHEENKSGWLTKFGGNALRRTWKRRWFELRGSSLYYYRQQNDPEPSGFINLMAYDSISQDSSATKKSSNCIRIEKTNDSIRSNLDFCESSTKKPINFLAFADTETEMQEWIMVLEKRLGGRNIADIVLDRLELAGNIHRRQGSYGSLRSFYSRNSSFCSSGGSTSGSTLSSRRPSLDSLSLDTPLNSRKSSIDSYNGTQSSASLLQSQSRSETPSNLVAILGLGQPILRKPTSCSGLQDKRVNNPVDNNAHPGSHHSYVRKRSLTFSKELSIRAPSAPLIMVHGENAKFTSSPDIVYFPNSAGIKSSGLSNSYSSKKKAGNSESAEISLPSSPVTPLANVFPSHLN